MPCTVFCRNTDVAFVSLVLMGAAFLFSSYRVGFAGAMP